MLRSFFGVLRVVICADHPCTSDSSNLYRYCRFTIVYFECCIHGHLQLRTWSYGLEGVLCLYLLASGFLSTNGVQQEHVAQCCNMHMECINLSKVREICMIFREFPVNSGSLCGIQKIPLPSSSGPDFASSLRAQLLATRRNPNSWIPVVQIGNGNAQVYLDGCV